MGNFLNTVTAAVAGAFGALATTSFSDSPPAVVGLGGAFIVLGNAVGKIVGALFDDAGFARRIPKPRSSAFYTWEGFGALLGAVIGALGFLINVLIVLL